MASNATLFALAYTYVSTAAGASRLKTRLNIADRELAMLCESTAVRVGMSTYMAMAYIVHAASRGAVVLLVSPPAGDPGMWHLYEIGVGATRPHILIGAT